MSSKVTVAPPLERLAPLFPQLEIDGLMVVNDLSAVFRARQTGLDRQVALKILPEFIAKDDKLIDAFTADARTMAPLQHPNLVRVFDFGESDGLLWVIQEWVEGQTLREILAEGAMSVQRAGELLVHICRGLGHAHEHGAIHGDIRATHLMVDTKDRVKLMNFGLGRLMLAEADINMPGVVAPELLDPDLEVDHRADIFALGVLLYEMLVGERPVGEVELPSVARPGVVGPEFDEIVGRCLQPEPGERFQDCTSLRKALENLVKVPAPSTPPPRTTAVRPITPRPGLSSLPKQTPVYFPDEQADRPKWPLILGLLVAIAIGGWFVKRHYANIEQIEADHDRKTKDVEEKIAENERAMEEAKRAENGGAEEAPDPSGENPSEDPEVVMIDDPPGEDDTDTDIADAGDDPMADDDPPPEPVADLDPDATGENPEPAGANPALVEAPPLAPELLTLVPEIPELERLRAQLRQNAAASIAEVSQKLGVLRAKYSAACEEQRGSATGDDVEFWDDEQGSLHLRGRLGLDMPEFPPAGMEPMRAGWERDFAREVSPLASYRQIYLEELAKIRHTYTRNGDDHAVTALTLERSAAIEPDYFYYLCSDRLDQCGVIVPGNVAHVSMGSVASGVEKPENLHDGLDNLCSGKIRQPIRLELGGLLRLKRIRFVLNSHNPNHYFRYYARVSPDGENWESIADRAHEGEWKQEQVIEFAARPVRFIQLVGTYNSLKNGFFSIRELEAFCTTEGG